ncbi:hypothetical protein ACHAWF_009264 [Thalassiosira exigua]
MSEATGRIPSGKAVIGGEGQENGDVNGRAAMNIKVDPGSSMSTSYDEDDDYVSPRTLIMASKSSEEEVAMPNTKVKSRHKWIEETLLKEKKPLSENPLSENPKTRHSLPAPASSTLPQSVAKPPRSSLGTQDDVIARARAAIEGRKQSRETAKAKADAAMASIVDETELAISYSTSTLNSGENNADSTRASAPPTKHEVEAKDPSETATQSIPSNDAKTVMADPLDAVKAKARSASEVRAKAQARLDATMALLADRSRSEGKPRASTSRATPRGDGGAIKAGELKPEISEKLPTAEPPNVKSAEHPIATHVSGKHLDQGAEISNKESKHNMKMPKDQKGGEEQQNEQLADAHVGLNKDEMETAFSKAAKAETERLEDEKVEEEKPLIQQLESEKDVERSTDVQPTIEESKQDNFGDTEEAVEHKSDSVEQQEQEKEENELEDAKAEAKHSEEARLAAAAKEEAQRLADVWTQTERLKYEMLAVDAVEQAELAKKVEHQRALERRKEEEARRLKELKVKHLAGERMAALKVDHEAEKRKQEEEAHRLAEADAQPLEEEIAAQIAETNQLEEGHADIEVGEMSSKDDDDSLNDDSTQPSIVFDPIANDSYSCSTSTARLLEKPTEASDTTSMGEVDRILFQGRNDVHREDNFFDRHDSEERKPGDTPTSSLEIEMPTIDLDNVESSIDPNASPGPLWKRATEEAAFSTALKSDFLPRNAPSLSGAKDEPEPSPPIVPNSSNLSTKNETQQALSYSNTLQEYREEYRHDWQDNDKTTERDDEAGLIEWKGFNRDRMIYVVALGILYGILPALYGLTTCHFITGTTEVGEDEVEFEIYYGLQRFTSIDSAFQGHSHCLSYNRKYNYDPPSVPMMASVAGILFGTIPLVAIGVFLRHSLTHRLVWIGSVWMLYCASLFQSISVASMFFLDICRDGTTCSMGPGACASIFCALVWCLLAVEMKRNSPFIQAVQGEGVVVIEKDWPIVLWVKKSWQRLNDLIDGEQSQSHTPSLSRTAMKKQKGRIGTAVLTETANYRPPEMV